MKEGCLWINKEDFSLPQKLGDQSDINHPDFSAGVTTSEELTEHSGFQAPNPWYRAPQSVLILKFFNNNFSLPAVE